MTIEIPWDRLVENTHDWNLVGNTMSVGQTNGASVDIRSDGGGLWMATLNNIRFLKAADTLLWRSLRQIANGGAVPLIVPRRDTTWTPFPVDDAPYSPIPHDDGAYFGDGSGYYQSSIDIACHGGAVLRGTSMVVRLNSSSVLQGGECFSIKHAIYGWRLYEIGTAVDNNDGTFTITFNPPLRESVVDGESLEFDRPRCIMKLVNSSGMNFSNSTFPFSLASVTFVESKYAT